MGRVAQVRIGMPVYRTILPHTVGSIWGLRTADVILDLQVGADCAIGRNKIIKRLKEPYLLLVDSDMQFDHKHLAMLFEALKEDPERGAVAAHYIRWDGTCEPVCNWRDNGKWIDNRTRAQRTVDYQKEGIVAEVDMCGGGLWLLRKEVFESIPEPWFHPEVQDVEGYGPALYGNDTNFVQKMKKAGWKPCVHFGCQIGHVGPSVWHVEALEQLLKSMGTEGVQSGVKLGDGDGN